MLGHEGKGSLLSELKKREWCSYLSAGEELSVENFGFFKVSTDLTVAGMDHVDDIVEMVFQYLDLLRRYSHTITFLKEFVLFKVRHRPVVFEEFRTWLYQDFSLEKGHY